jgi:hypothetical protein
MQASHRCGIKKIRTLQDFNLTALKKYLLDSKKEYLAHDSKTWRRDYFDKKTGGYLVTNRQRIEHSKISKSERKKFKNEFEQALVYAKNGYRMEMFEEKPGIASPDVRINGILADLKRTASHNNIVNYAKKAITKQGAGVVLFEFDKMTPQIRNEIDKLKSRNIRGLYLITGENKVYAF